MPALISKKTLSDVIQKAFPIVPSKSSLQILTNFKMKCEKNILMVTATDLDQSIVMSCEVMNDGDDFEVAVNARKIFDIVRELPDGEVRFSVEDGMFSLRSESGFACKIAAADAKDYPTLPQRQATNEFSLEGKAFSKMVEKSAFAVAKDESRACLCGVFLEADEKSCSMVATDGHRLGKSQIAVDVGLKRKIGAIISPRSLQNAVKSLDGCSEKEALHIGFGEKYAWIKSGNADICAKLLDGPYPDYQRAIPQNNPKKAVCNRRMLIDALRRVCVLSNQKTNLVKFLFSSGNLEVSVLNRDIIGEASEAIPIEYEGPQHTIGFNGIYFSEILSIISSEKVRIEMNTEISACLLFPHPQQEQPGVEDLFLIMPLRIMDEA